MLFSQPHTEKWAFGKMQACGGAGVRVYQRVKCRAKVQVPQCGLGNMRPSKQRHAYSEAL